jgi:hypothetical protein
MDVPKADIQTSNFNPIATIAHIQRAPVVRQIYKSVFHEDCIKKISYCISYNSKVMKNLIDKKLNTHLKSIAAGHSLLQYSDSSAEGFRILTISHISLHPLV